MNAVPFTSRSRRAFTLVELLVASGVTVLLVGFIVAVVSNVSGFWTRSSGRLSAESQARYALDQLTLDLQSAQFRDNGATWLAASVPVNTATSTLWNTTGATTANLKPASAAGITPALIELAGRRSAQGRERAWHALEQDNFRDYVLRRCRADYLAQLHARLSQSGAAPDSGAIVTLDPLDPDAFVVDD